MIIDTHTHLDFPDYGNDVEEVILRAKKVGVEYFINVGVSVPSSTRSIELAQRFSEIFASVGIHPNEASNISEDDWACVETLVHKEKVVAIGETGLDYYRDRSSHDDQKKLFHQHLELATRTGLPVIIHNRDASDDCLDVLRAYDGKIEGVIHCFSGDKDVAEKFLDLGFHISFAGPVTFPKANALREVVRSVPVEKLVLETDCPFLAPQPLRGKRNEPSYLVHVIPVLAEQQKLSVGDIERITTHNAKKLFRIGKIDTQGKIAYVIRNSLYLNITSRCSNRCLFCSRETAPYVKGYYLGLEKEPTIEELITAIADPSSYDEVVFCGFGESTERLDVLTAVAKYLKEKGAVVRLDTNGLGDLINGRSICEELKGLIDTICISLNTDSADEYQRLCRPSFDGQSYSSLLSFIKKAKEFIPDVMVSVVSIPGVDIESCRKIAEELGVRFRVREYNNVG
ncbi:MAG: YchF/TatD family DNA exonuclease [Candidatus Scalindua sp. AMX11]|nr:MAG: YchF/TatD family DNA exonuclease [Candidatus Scalindua sp.]NOG83027.1 YchF/TatD family DNA exonuclease [Planctomycetota bacterium]RZV79571.1 MAG: YchF/TatD family DNA exonuclease [Candidatus Scalindua sp. SCAELEC01]TDE65211.1 MAG: YchF/TatD family DNA exonuclease [Candidatus Scalindua sp. AMX11]GJQ58551.1 MAG: radical SAM protein [Candidatus Scalindua sp.]